MRAMWWAVTVGLIFFYQPLSAHRLDEYLQATTVALGRSQLTFVMRLTPGVKVMDAVLRAIDPDGDGQISETEQRNYAASVLRDLRITVDGEIIQPVLTTVSFPAVAELKEGSAEIVLVFEAPFPAKAEPRRLVFENRHQSKISAYLVNSLQPLTGISILKQERNYEQSSYKLTFVIAGVTQLPSRLR
jgi:hypothetical protein